jgi:ATPase subunit of ABC transporter with duplicated ATPase domains
MHISKGILSTPILISGGALTAAGTAIGLKKLDYDRMMDVAFGLLNLRANPAEAWKMALKELGLAELEKRITHQLSGGEKKLVSLATILAMQPRALLLDEPSNNLDPATRARLIEILNGLDLPLVIISHDWDFLAETQPGYLCHGSGPGGIVRQVMPP